MCYLAELNFYKIIPVGDYKNNVGRMFVKTFQNMVDQTTSVLDLSRMLYCIKNCYFQMLVNWSSDPNIQI